MILLGTIVNSLAILAGGLIGWMLGGGLKANYRLTIMQALGLAVILVGLKAALQTTDILLVIISLGAGTLLGEWLQIEERLNSLGRWLEERVAGQGSGVARGFVTASLVFCVGAMAVVGPLESGLANSHQTLYAKSILDGIAALVFTTTLGVGVLFSALSVAIYQGTIACAAGWLQPLLSPAVVSQMSAVGGLLIVAIGINLLEIKVVRVGNMLPAIAIPPAWFALRLSIG
jgi:uncharacterized protein